jgi:hypothetical protein
MEFVNKTCRSYRYGPPLYLVATLAALVDARLSLGNLYGIVDLLGYHHHQKHHGLKDQEGTSQVRGSELSLGGRGFSPGVRTLRRVGFSP